MPDSTSIFFRSHENEPDALAPPRRVPDPAAVRLRVLVVEDNSDAATGLSLLMGLLGHEVRVCHTGLDGVREALDWYPDAVLCDISLPLLDGYQVARILGELPATHGTRLVALSARDGATDRRRAFEAGFHHFLTKPADQDDLLRLLRTIE